jgi:CRISPR/Cas system-associated exonuclease Cas4 (RecB family)
MPRGRPQGTKKLPEDAKRRELRLTDEEFAAVKKLVREIRATREDNPPQN